ncbi:MAG: DUF2520 domain-containing protein [Porticoccaceae bacterium]|jgi:predicted short-subunit dehydrogenase-like oxidoreductase (DUF2520 family)|nr:DUF2520 domain-containing protein [Porticoccaceae bacterium]
MNTPAAAITNLTVSCIGAGRLGTTLCRLLLDQQSDINVSIGQVLNNSFESSLEAVEFIGAGTAVKDSQRLNPADIWMITTPDDAVQEVCEALSGSGVLAPGNIVLHCSGALSSKIIRLPSEQCYRASVHPIHSFADPETSLSSFAGSSCAVEGDPEAKVLLNKLFSSIGGNCFPVKSGTKALYHAATVMACNNLVALLTMSKQMLAEADIDQSQQDQILNPLIRQTVDNYLNNADPAAVLTGPISRGDHNTVEAHLDALSAQRHWRDAYTALGETAVSIAQQQGYASDDELEKIVNLLTKTPDY